MSSINIIIIVILVFILFWGMNNIFFKTNIIYDKMCEAAKTIPTGTSLANITSSNENVILAKDIPEITSSNFMLSVWFYIDNWGQYISREKNILYVANSPNSLTAPGLPENLSGLSTMVKIPSPTANVVILPKNINIALDKFENNLFIDIECFPDKVADEGKTIYTRYKIPNIPVQKWNNLTISVDTRTLDVYLDGKLRNSFIMHGLYKNYYDTVTLTKNIYLGNINTTASNIGFEGFVTRIRYIGNSINPQEAYNIYKEGINASLINTLYNKYSLKVSFLEYKTEKASFQI
uniref:LamG domain-containing protein n=1 Tax=viral metagenome TaxID=1070528 RepID=A0A6C0H520_9ZZZZ